MGFPTTYVLLIRHGDNDWVGQNRLAGRTPGVHLNDSGKKQAADIAETLSGYELSSIYSSPMERCLETAQAVADKLSLEVTPEPGVLEVDYGEWQGGSIKDLAKTPEWQLVQHSPSSFRFPGGETLFEVQVRAIDAIERIRQRHPDQVVAVFSHGDVIRTAVAHYLGIPFDLFQRVIISTASVSAVAFSGPVSRVLFTNYLSRLPKFEFERDGEGPEKPHGEKEAQRDAESGTEYV